MNEMPNDCPDVNEGIFEFALIIAGVTELTDEVLDRLFEAGCDDATASIQHGVLYLEFSRSDASLEHAILSAIHDVTNAEIGAEVRRVDQYDLVTPAEIARRIGRSRQLVHQYIRGDRGPGGFPAPDRQLRGAHPLWSWCSVSRWLAAHDLLQPEQSHHATVLGAINNLLERRHLPTELVDELSRRLPSPGR